MIIKVRVHPNSKKREIVKGNVWNIYLKSRPENGKANNELIKLIRKELGKNVKIVHGKKSKDKILEIGD